MIRIRKLVALLRLELNICEFCFKTHAQRVDKVEMFCSGFNPVITKVLQNFASLFLMIVNG